MKSNSIKCKNVILKVPTDIRGDSEHTKEGVVLPDGRLLVFQGEYSWIWNSVKEEETYNNSDRVTCYWEVIDFEFYTKDSLDLAISKAIDMI